MTVNTLTVSRVPFIAAFMVCAVVAGMCENNHCLVLELLAGLFMFISGITDLFDGMLARRWNVVSTFGKMADPLMDKIFFIIVFPTLMWLSARLGDSTHTLILLIFTVSYILRDQWVTFLRSVGSYFKADVGALWLGKVRTALSFPAAGVIYSYLALDHYFEEFGIPVGSKVFTTAVYLVEAAMILLTLWSAAYYTKYYLPYIRRAIHPEQNNDSF